MKTAVACPEPPRRPNETVAWTSSTSATLGSNTHVEWQRIDVRQ
jgi:hypothetical protein